MIGLFGYPQNGLGMPLLVAVFTLGRGLELRRCVPYLVAVVAVYTVLYVLSRDPVPVSDPFLTFAFLGPGSGSGPTCGSGRAEAAGRRWPRSGCGSRASCTTWSRTA